MIVRSLTVHARYACQHSGACCTAGWPIPVEADQLDVLADAVEDARLVAPSLTRPLWIQPHDAPLETPARLQSDDHGCVFHERNDGGRCRIHRVLGHGALPLACRQFPRVSVVDPRGASVTLSHYCPTAAGLLADGARIAITNEPPAVPVGTEVVGLDVSSRLPPLLRPDMLMDWDGWWEWERRAVETIGRSDRPVEYALTTLATAVESVRTWKPADGTLLRAIDDAFENCGDSMERPATSAAAAIAEVMSAVPADLRPIQLNRSESPSATLLRAFVAAHAFANWTAHLGQGLRSWLRSVEVASALGNELGVRQADLLLRHLADPHELARIYSRAEY